MLTRGMAPRLQSPTDRKHFTSTRFPFNAALTDPQSTPCEIHAALQDNIKSTSFDFFFLNENKQAALKEPDKLAVTHLLVPSRDVVRSAEFRRAAAVESKFY